LLSNVKVRLTSIGTRLVFALHLLVFGAKRLYKSKTQQLQSKSRELNKRNIACGAKQV